MAVEIKAQILAAIKAKYPAINLSKKRLDQIATKIEEKVIDDETKIDAALTTFNEYHPLAEMAANDDRLRNAEKKLKEGTPAPGKEDPKKTETPPADPPATVPDDAPAYVKAMMDQMKAMSSIIQGFQGERQATSIKSKAEAALKDVPAAFWNKRPLPEKDEDMEAFVTDVNTDYQAFTKDMTAQGFKFMPPPASGTPPPAGGQSNKVDPGLKAYLDRKAEANKTAPPVNNGFVIKST